MLPPDFDPRRPPVDRRTTGNGEAASRPGSPAPQRGTPASERVGLPLTLLLVWLWFEFGRPPNPLYIPMLLSIAMFAGWLLRKDKRWSAQQSWMVALLAIIVVSVPLAANTYSAYQATYGMMVTLLTVCIPLASLVTSARKVRAWAYTFVAISLYVGVWAVFHGGFGPAGSAGAQDENYVSAMMAMAIPFAYFSLFTERRPPVRLLLMLSLGVFTAAIVVGLSRGGFVALCAVGLYCLARSPRKLLGGVVVAVITVGLLLFAGADYWKEMGTITDTSEDTADLRLEIWQVGLTMWAANPVLGVGPGNFRWRVGDYQSLEQMEKFGRSFQGSIVAHSLWVELVAELGTAGIVVMLALLLGTVRNLRQLRQDVPRPRRAHEADDRWPLACYADAIIGSLIGCLVAGVFLSLLYFSYLWLLIALGSAITQTYRAQVRELSAPSGDGPVRATPAAR